SPPFYDRSRPRLSSSLSSARSRSPSSGRAMRTKAILPRSQAAKSGRFWRSGPCERSRAGGRNPKSVRPPIHQYSVDIRTPLIPVPTQMLPEDDQAEQLRSRIGEKAKVPLPGTPQRRPIVGLLQPEIIPIVPQNDQTRIIGVPGRNKTGLHTGFHWTLPLHSS